ncbi:hypothetical protein C1646_753192 [Rhizophagus diaphanus]|nr:hypothetical protein C1646_753192 [Rhizophagus diaphanus] [Rhizophagus sp. MUCL 43196]
MGGVASSFHVRKLKSLESSIEQPWASEDKWMDFIIQVLLLIESIKKYISYLQEVNQKMNTIHYSDISIRNPGCDLKVYTIEVSDSIHSKYEELSNFLLEKDSYEFFDLDEYTSYDVIQKYNYIKNLQLNVPVTIYRYYQETENARTIAAINENLPKYYTRQMHKNALKKYSLFKKVTPVVLRTFDLTGDVSTTNNVISKEIEERLRIMMQLKDPSIIVDLHTNNGFKGKEFNCFWDEMGAYFNENTPAVDDR